MDRPVSTVALCIRKTQKPFAMDAAPSDSEKDSMVDLIQSAEDEGPTQLHSAMHRSRPNTSCVATACLMGRMQDWMPYGCNIMNEGLASARQCA